MTTRELIKSLPDNIQDRINNLRDEYRKEKNRFCTLIEQEEINLPNGHKMRVTLSRYGDEYDVHTEQHCRGFFSAPTESSCDGWRTVMFTTHRDITDARKEYAARLESLKTRGF